MTRRPVANVARSVHQRLLTQAKKEGRPFNELLQHYAIERFLYWLGQSHHAEKLLLKGALLLRIWHVPRARPTMDIDVLGRAARTPEALAGVLRDCMSANVDEDGMRYDPESVTTDVNAREADYPGWRIRFEASLGNARATMQVDVGIGDVVYPAPIWIGYAVLLDHAAPHLRGLERGAVSNCPARDGPVAVVSCARKTPGSRQITDYVPSAGRRPAQWAWLVRSAKSKGVVGGSRP